MNDTQSNSMAYELLVELKISQRRWFIIAVVELCIILALAGGMFWYFSLPVEEVTDTQTVEDIDDSNINQHIGDKYGKSKTD